MAAVSTIVMAAGVALAYDASQKSLKQQKQMYEDQKELQEEAKEDFDKRIEKYEQSEFVPLDIEALKTENVYEELEVDTSAADYAREQFQQQQANIMQSLKGVAGSSGIAALSTGMSKELISLN
jgi:L-lactate utilization protein LutC